MSSISSTPVSSLDSSSTTPRIHGQGILGQIGLEDHELVHGRPVVGDLEGHGTGRSRGRVRGNREVLLGDGDGGPACGRLTRGRVVVSSSPRRMPHRSSRAKRSGRRAPNAILSDPHRIPLLVLPSPPRPIEAPLYPLSSGPPVSARVARASAMTCSLSPGRRTRRHLSFSPPVACITRKTARPRPGASRAAPGARARWTTSGPAAGRTGSSRPGPSRPPYGTGRPVGPGLRHPGNVGSRGTRARRGGRRRLPACPRRTRSPPGSASP